VIDPAPIAILLGLRGSGKSTLSKSLATRLDRPWLDLDHAVLARLGVDSVAEAFSQLGEPAFREAEALSLAEAVRTPIVLALGGGTPFVVGGRELIEDAKRRGSLVIWTDAPDRVLAARIASGSDRPPLRGDDAAGEIALLRSERQRTYRALADLRIDTEAFPPVLAVEAILRALQDRGIS
jgi:shikimate kinase